MKKARMIRSAVVLITAILMCTTMAGCSDSNEASELATMTTTEMTTESMTETSTTETTIETVTEPTTTTTEETTEVDFVIANCGDLPTVDAKTAGIDLLAHFCELSSIEELNKMEVGDSAMELADALNIVSKRCRAKSAGYCTIEDIMGIFIKERTPIAIQNEAGDWIVLEHWYKESDRLNCFTSDGFESFKVEDFSESYDVVFLDFVGLP